MRPTIVSASELYYEVNARGARVLLLMAISAAAGSVATIFALLILVDLFGAI